MNNVLTEETLFRFVDGECSPSEELEVLEAERKDPDFAQQIRDIREQNALLRAALDLELECEMPESFASMASLKQPIWACVPNVNLGQRGVTIIATCLIAAVALGTAWSHWRITRWQESIISISAQQEATLANAIQEGLESYLSGEVFEVNDPSLDIVAVVQPEETYKSTSGHWCRSFSERVKTSWTDFERQAIACRENDTNGWTRVKTVIDGPIENNLMLSGLDLPKE